jgi:hypothetical protein
MRQVISLVLRASTVAQFDAFKVGKGQSPPCGLKQFNTQDSVLRGQDIDLPHFDGISFRYDSKHGDNFKLFGQANQLSEVYTSLPKPKRRIGFPPPPTLSLTEHVKIVVMK